MWYLYIIENKQRTYVGVSPYPIRRLRQHNGEIKGGAKYTTSFGPGWKHVCLVEGFRDKIEAMQFEWAVKHAPPRNVGGIMSRIKKMQNIMHKEKWTTKSPLSKDVPLVIIMVQNIDIEWKIPDNCSVKNYLDDNQILKFKL